MSAYEIEVVETNPVALSSRTVYVDVFEDGSTAKIRFGTVYEINLSHDDLCRLISALEYVRDLGKNKIFPPGKYRPK